MCTRDFSLKVKALSEEGAFTGMAVVYGDRDLQDDVIEPGAFKAAIAMQGKGYPLLWAHKQDQPIGLVRIEDAREGLAVQGQLLLEDPAAQRAHMHMKAGSMKGLSIGYLPPRSPGKVAYRDDGARVLKELQLFEISLVSVPAQPRALISSVKSLGDVRLVLKSLKDGDVDADVIGELLEIDRELRRLLVGNDPAEQKALMLSELRAFDEELRRIAV
jgi:HK97 family phage prohead protease